MALLKACKENNKYFVNENGEVFNGKGHKMAQHDNTYGYMTVCLWNGKKHTKYYVHRLVANAFLRKRKNANQVNHIDGNKYNNHLSNLEWVTASENERHALNLGLRKHGENCSFSKLTKDQVLEIRASYIKRVVTYDILAKKYGVCKQQIERIVNNKRWTRTINQ